MMLHGGNIWKYEEYGKLLDFSTNINPLGPPEGCLLHMEKNLDVLTTYPDIHCRSIRRDIEKYISMPAKNILVTNGAMEAIESIVRLFDSVVVCNPCFSEYALAARRQGKPVVEKKFVRVETSRGIEYKLPEISDFQDIEKNALVILGNPNNPTGTSLTIDEVKDIYALCQRRQAALLLDEAFVEFSSCRYDTLHGVFFDSEVPDDLFVVRAATKVFGLPGLRLGYAVASTKNIREITKYLPPWTVNGLCAVASEVLWDEEYVARSRKYIKDARNAMIEGLRALKTIQHVVSDANFLLLEVKGDVESLFCHLLERGILVRRTESFTALSHPYPSIRVAVRRREENDVLIEALKAWEAKA